MPVTDEDIVRDLLHRATDHVQPPGSIAAEVIARQQRRDRHRRVVSLAATGAALATAAGVIAVVPGGQATRAPGTTAPGTGQATSTKPAITLTADQRVLDKLSSAAASQATGTGRYVVMMTQGQDVKDTSVFDSLTGDMWSYQQGTDGSPSGKGYTKDYSPTAAQFNAMPTSATALRAALIAEWDAANKPVPKPVRKGHPVPIPRPIPVSDNDKVFQQATYLLWYPLAGPALRSALYRVLATVPGVTVRSSAHDASGRPGGRDQPDRHERAVRRQVGREDVRDVREPRHRRRPRIDGHVPAGVRHGHSPGPERNRHDRRRHRVLVRHQDKHHPVRPLRGVMGGLAEATVRSAEGF